MEKLILSSHRSPVWERVHAYSCLQEASNQIGSSADLLGVPLPDIEYKGVRFKTVQVKYTKKVKRVTLERFLIGKLVHFTNKFTRIDILFMYDNLIHLQELAERDEGFRNKFGSDLESLTRILKSFTLSPKSSILDLEKLKSQIMKNIPSFPYPLRNMSTVETHVRTMFYITRYTELGVDTKILPPKPYIGMGYTDKGTAKKPWLDGSPSWQEVAAQPLYQEEIDDEKEKHPTFEDF